MEIRLKANSLTELELLFKSAMEDLKKKAQKEDQNVEMVTQPNGASYMVDPIG